MRLARAVPPVLAALVTACAAPVPRAGVDQRAEPPLPEPRQEVASAATTAGLWVVGGFDRTARSTPTVSRSAGQPGHREPALPIGLDHPAAAALGDRLYVAGGYSAGTASRRVFTVPGLKEVAPLHHARGGLALVATGGRLYALGGDERG